MHITRVELENIKSYERADFRFEPGTTAIVGRNGAGKTTILEAIAWTLFDNLEYSKDDFVRRGAKKGMARVTFLSDRDERQYTVCRDTGNGYYVVDAALGLRPAERKKDVTDFIHQHLDVEPGTDLRALFRSAIGVPQGLFTAAFLQPSVQRKSAFDRLLKVEEYREGAERLLATVRLIAERINDVRMRIHGAETQLARYDEQNDERLRAEENEAAFTNALARIEATVTEHTAALALLDADERAVGEARLRRERLAVERDNAARRLRDAEVELEAAASAVERQQASADDHVRHTAALLSLRALERLRAERDALLRRTEAAERAVLLAENEHAKISDALEGAECAQDALLALAPDIERQTELERERERQRDMRAQMVAARDAAARLERDLQTLRQQHKATSERLRLAERGQGAQARLEDLEIERMGLDAELSKLREDATNYKHLFEQRRELAAEVVRLRGVTVNLTDDIENLAAREQAAAGVAQLEIDERAVAEQVARLRAEINRDERMRKEIAGGLCPILSQKCLNIPVDQTLDGYFTINIHANRDALISAEQTHESLHQAVRAARDAAAHITNLAHLRQSLRRESDLLLAREATLADIEAKLNALGKPSPAREREISNKLIGVNSALIARRDEAILYAEAEPLRLRLQEIADEGKSRRDEQAEFAAAANGIEAIDLDAAATDARLAALRDPRTRRAALSREAERATLLREQLATSTQNVATARQETARLIADAKRFAALDDDLQITSDERDRTAAGYQTYIAAADLAAALPARQTRVAASAAEAAALAAEAAKADDEYEALVARYDRDAHDRARGELQAAREQSVVTSQRLQHTQNELARLRQELLRLDAIREEMRAELNEKQRLERLHETTDFVRETLKKAGPLVTESYLYNISIDANQLFREITGEAGRTLRWTRDYEVLLEEAGHERSFANLSGGEQMVAALSIRLALLKQLSDIRFAIFDEPTTNMDAERRERLAGVIGQFRDFDRHFHQLFVISHDEAFEESADHRVRVPEDNAAETHTHEEAAA